MDVTIKKSDLLSALSTIMSAIDTDNNIGTLSCVALQSYDSNVLRVRGTDLTTAVVASLSCVNNASGSVVVEASQLATCLKTMGGSEISLITKANEKLSIKSGKTKFDLNTVPRADFNKMPKAEHPDWIPIPGSKLLDVISKTAEFAHEDKTRYNINGVSVVGGENKTTFTSINGFVLSRTTIEGSVLTDKPIIIPLKGCEVLKKILKRSETAQTCIQNDVLFIKHSDYEFSVKLTNDTFPDISQAFKMPISTLVFVEKAVIMDIVKRAIVLKKDAPDITLQVRQGKIGFFVYSQLLGSLEDEIPAQTMGSEFDLLLSIEFLMRAIRSMESTVIALGLHGPLNPIFLRPVAQDSYDHLISMMTKRPD